MSDTFNHGLDAYESMEYDEDYCHDQDPLFYHTRIDLKVIHQTAKAILIEYKDFPHFWVPLKICRNLTDVSTYVHYKTFLSILRQCIESDKSPFTSA